MSWQRDMTDYTLPPDQSSLAVVRNVRDVIGKEVQGANLMEQHMNVLLRLLSPASNLYPVATCCIATQQKRLP